MLPQAGHVATQHPPSSKASRSIDRFRSASRLKTTTSYEPAVQMNPPPALVSHVVPSGLEEFLSGPKAARSLELPRARWEPRPLRDSLESYFAFCAVFVTRCSRRCST